TIAAPFSTKNSRVTTRTSTGRQYAIEYGKPNCSGSAHPISDYIIA
ncbi:unnamed protein product, partial [Urochloa humidicola]